MRHPPVEHPPVGTSYGTSSNVILSLGRPSHVDTLPAHAGCIITFEGKIDAYALTQRRERLLNRLPCLPADISHVRRLWDRNEVASMPVCFGYAGERKGSRITNMDIEPFARTSSPSDCEAGQHSIERSILSFAGDIICEGILGNGSRPHVEGKLRPLIQVRV